MPGLRAGERVRSGDREGNLLIVDFDLPDVALLKRLCVEVGLERTTCVRTGGNHAGYHLYYLAECEVRKHGMLLYEDASVDLLGRGSFAVAPPSTVEKPYRVLIGLDEMAVLCEQRYQKLLDTLGRWKEVALALKKLRRGALTVAEVREALAGERFTDRCARSPKRDGPPVRDTVPPHGFYGAGRFRLEVRVHAAARRTHGSRPPSSSR